MQRAVPTSPARHESSTRRAVRVRADLQVVLARRSGEKTPARVIDVSTGGMHLSTDRAPEYGEALTVVVQLRESGDWYFLPATVRWFTRKGFGVEFDALDTRQARALAQFVAQAAA